jgi:hypothetical protein
MVSERTDPNGELVIVAPPRRVPGRVQQYDLGPLIGAGGAGEVYRATDRDLGRPVAIKVLRWAGRDPAALLREAQIMARLSHPNVLTVHEAMREGDEVFVAMELVEGDTLRAWLAERARPWREIVAVFVAAGRGLAAAHAAGVIHGDFKPDNVLVGADGRVRVADFGLAGSPAAAAVELGALDTVRYSVAAAGTPAYMAPEQHLRQRVDERADQFSFCVALHEALFGARPFPGETAAAIRERVLAGAIAAPAQRRRAPRWLRAVVLRGLQLDRERRHPSMAALIDALAGPRRRWMWAAAAALVAAAIGGARLAPGPAPAPAASCLPQTPEERLAGIWDAGARASLARRLLDAGSAEQDVGRLRARLDAHVAEWAAAGHDACAAPSRREIGVRLACLERRARDLGVLLRQLGVRSLDARRALEAVEDLEDAASCADGARLAIAGLPDPALRPRVAQILARVDLALAQTRLGDHAAARPIAREALVSAREIGFAPLIARALYVDGRIDDALGEPRAAEATLQASLATATAVVVESTRAQAAERLVAILAREPSRAGEARAMLAVARDAAARARDGRRQALLACEEGRLLVREGRRADGVRALERCVEGLTAARGPESAGATAARELLAVSR